VEAFRLTRRKYADAAFNAAGARRTGGRWHPRGAAVAYASEHLSLAALEYLVHVDPEDAPKDLVSLRIDIPDDLVEDADVSLLPPSWRMEPAPPELAELGRRWLERHSAVALRVPSAIVPSEFNVVIDSLSTTLDRCMIAAPEPFSFDPRLWK
jgi:RES domain-containing protein